LSKGLIRISLPVPDAAKRHFEIVEVNDPFGAGTPANISVYRRPLPATNLSFASSVMWDLRETTTGFLLPPFTPDVTMVPPLKDQLVRQAINATLGHAEAMAPGLTAEQVEAIVNFEMSLYSAQTTVTGVGDLASNGARGGAHALLNQPVTPVCGNLDVYSNDPMYPQCQQYKFDPNSFTIFDGWVKTQGADSRSTLRASIARGQVLFNTRKTQSPPDVFFNHSGDNKNLTCSTCHASFNTGSSSVPIGFANVVVSSGPSVFNSPNAPTDFIDPEMPTYRLRCNANGMAAFVRSMGLTGCHDGTEPDVPADELTVNDPGRALITGTWQSVGAFKCPTLRNLSARAPYFHDGSAATLADVVEHYKKALGFEFTDAEKQDLVNFMSAL
jgi:cytochrome c peroxidase